MTRPETKPFLLGEKAKGDIGSFFLSNLLSTTEKNMNFQLPFGEIVSSLAKNEGVQIPESLVIQLELGTLRWDYASISASLPILFVGRKELPHSRPASVTEAEATIEIARRMDINTGLPVPFYLRIAGIMGDRIVAATYDLTKPEKPLTDLNVSISTPELDSLKTHIRSVILSGMTIFLPSNPTSPYNTAGLVTAGMLSKIISEKPQQSFDKRALSIVTNERGIYFVRRELSLDSIGLSLTRTVEELGYYAKREHKLITVGLAKEAAEKRGLAPWEIVIPNSLLPTPPKQS